MHVLVVCLGNWCRSPMAKAFLAESLGPDNVASAGLEPDGYGADPKAQRAVEQYGLDLSGHRQRALSDELVGWADVILTMEDYQSRNLITRFPDASDKTFTMRELARYVERDRPDDLLSHLSVWASHRDEEGLERGDLDIDDPWGYSQEVFDVCAKEIAEVGEAVVSAAQHGK